MRRRDHFHRNWHVMLVVLLLFLSASLEAVGFSFLSQNCLHLGQGEVPYQTNKYNKLRELFTNYDVIMLQEVMRQVQAGHVTPGHYTWLISELKGASSYKESYAFLIGPNMGCYDDVEDYPDDDGDFSRPPSGALVRDGDGEWTWVVSFHAIFGKSKGVRRAEAAKMDGVYRYFQVVEVEGETYDRVVIGGDWNLSAGEVLHEMGDNYQAEPTGKTSLKRNGQESSSYDHFVWSAMSGVNLNNIRVINPGIVQYTNYEWRNNISDHLGISCDVD